MLSRLQVPHFLTSALILLGVSVIAGYALSNAALVQALPGSPAMVLSTALAFVLSGCTLLLMRCTSRPASTVRTALAIAVIVLAGATLVETVFDVDMGLHWHALHEWVQDAGHPGRMPADTAVALLAAGFAFLLLGPRGLRTRFHFGLVALLVLVTLLLGLRGLIGQTLTLHMLPGWFVSSHMALHAAGGLIILSLGLWTLWLDRGEEAGRLGPDDRINLLAAFILVVVALTIGLASFAALRSEMQRELANGLSQTLKSRIEIFTTAVRQRQRNIDLLLHDTSQIEYAHTVLERPTDENARQAFGTLMRLRMSDDVRHVALRTPDDVTIEIFGTPQASDAIWTVLDGSPYSNLVWDGEYLIKTVSSLYDADDRLLGELIVSEAMHEVTRMFMSDPGFGATGELMACVIRDDSLDCFPEFRDGRSPTMRIASAFRLAMDDGGGFYNGLDYRGVNVVAAYAPLPDPGLRMMLKQDTAEIYAPIAEQLTVLLPLLLLLTAGGIALLRTQVNPLAARLVYSERDARRTHEDLAEKEQRMRAVVDNMGDGIVTTDRHAVIESVNPAACSIFGYTAEELIGQPLHVLTPLLSEESNSASLQRYVEAAEARIVDQGTMVRTGLRKDGVEIPLEVLVTQIGEGEELRFVGILRDISERMAAESALQQEKERLRVTLHSIGDAVVSTDTRARITYLNPVAEELTGWTSEAALGQNAERVFCIMNQETGEPAASPLQCVLETDQSEAHPEFTELVSRDGTRISIEHSASPIRGPDGHSTGAVIVFRDVTEARRMSQKMSHQASHDALTNLYNRREFEHRLSNAIAETDGIKGVALLYLDLDQFKIVNDTCGHLAGDELLKLLGAILQRTLRSDDTLARLGGDEFAVILENCTLDAALRVAENLRQATSDFQFVWQDKGFPVRASIGVVHTLGEHTLSDLLRSADAACYMAKDKGRDRIHLYQESDADLQQRNGEMSWVTRIEKALGDDRFCLYAQPVVPIREITEFPGDHFEVLVRMIDENGAIIPPMAFIPAAERYNMMARIDRWTIEHSFRALAAYKDNDRTVYFAINLSAMSINDDSLLPFLRERLAYYGVDPQRLTFEVTETSAISNLTQSSRMMHELKALGCRFSLDDFGSGMSSFAYLKHLPVDYVKIDGSFVKDMDHDPIDREMVACINNMAHVMNMKTIAEFVENQAIVERLQAIGVDYAQGYGIGKPGPLDEIVGAAAVVHEIALPA